MSKMTKRARILAGCLALLAAAPIPATAAKVQQDSARSVKPDAASEMEQEAEIIDRRRHLRALEESARQARCQCRLSRFPPAP